MRRIAFLFCCAVAVALGQTAGTGSVIGHVYNSVTGEAIPGASVKAWPLTGPRKSDFPSTASQSDGSFRLESLTPGSYFIRVEKDGFVSEGARRGLVSEEVLAGQVSSDVQIALLPDGGISGKVSDGNGIPAAGVQVQPMALRSTGAPVRLQEAGPSATTDKAGHYSLPTLAPGNYFVVAVPDPAAQPPPNDDGYQQVPTFYPAGQSANDGSPVLVRPAESANADIKLASGLTHRIEGKLAEFPDDASLKQLRLWLEPADAPKIAILRRSIAINPDRSFSAIGVSAGSYRLSLSGGKRRGRPLCKQAVEVGSDDVTGIVLRPMPPVSLTGLVTEDAPNPGPLGRVNIRALPAEDGQRALTAATPSGSFALNGLDAVTYLFVIQPSQPGLYVASLTLDGRDILNQSVDLSQISGGQIQAVLRPGAGEISGTVSPNATSMVVLVPQAVAPDGSNVQIGYTQGQAVFDFKNVPPGEYRLFATDRSPANVATWIQPAFLHAIESLGSGVHLDENGKQQVQLKSTDRTELADQALRLGLNFE